MDCDDATLATQLLSAAEAGDTATVDRLLTAGVPAYTQEDTHGASCLMLAARGGHGDVVELLLAAGAPWNAIDRQGRCAGNYALDAGFQTIVDRLVDAGVQAELLLGAASRIAQQNAAAAATAAASGESLEYLSRGVRYDGDRLLDEADDAVMMEWETPLMEAHADRLCATGGDVLNVGFGMGIIDGLIAARAPRSHTIMEAHPDVLRRIERDGWHARPGVRVLAGRWQESVHRLIAEGVQFDGIFYDTYGEHDTDMAEFHAMLPALLRPGGLYSFFNGMCPFNVFFQGVACAVVELELRALGFTSTFEPVDISSPDAQWEGVRRRYFQADTYYLPHCVLDGGERAESSAAAAADGDGLSALETADDGATVSIADDGAGAAAQLISLNRGLFRLLAQSCGWTGAADAVTDSTACRSLLRDHILPHLEAAGWRLLSPLEAIWRAISEPQPPHASASANQPTLDGATPPASSDQSATGREGAAAVEGTTPGVVCAFPKELAVAEAAKLDANSASVLLAVVEIVLSGPSQVEPDEEADLRLAILPNPLAPIDEELRAPMSAGVKTAGTEGETNKSDASVAGRDSASNVFTSVDELWAPAAAATADSSGIAAATDTNWYDVSHAHWAGVSADVSGMLGGLGGLHDVDVAASLKLIDELRAAETPLPDGVALDCGAGIGRVSSSVLLPRFGHVELVEPAKHLLEAARAQLPAERVRACHLSSLQAFVPPESARYALVWVQWVSNYLTDDDLIGVLRRCAVSLAGASARLVVKESISRDENGFFVDRSDASITRTDAHFRALFSAATLRVAHVERQPGMPRGVFPVNMYVLQPDV